MATPNMCKSAVDRQDTLGCMESTQMRAALIQIYRADFVCPILSNRGCVPCEEIDINQIS